MICDLTLVHMKCPGRKIIALRSAYHHIKGEMGMALQSENEAVIKAEIMKLYLDHYASVTFILASDTRAGDEATFPINDLIR
jgi:hypothetical protein